MLVKFQTKSNRVKGLVFHPTRPWLLASLHNGTIQLWDYRMGTLLDKFEEHEGPVRGCSFHPTQPIFVSGGDDGKIKVYNYQQKRCLFTLTGHTDYIRTVFFHHEAPWIVSASDDQTVRIWNWQSRSCIAVLTGHSHYVMCAQFHPKDDLIVSASLDQTIRVWDVSGLRRKHSSPAPSPYGDPSMLSPRSSHQIDLFAAPEGQTKFILEGHDRGVNWVQFHPTKPIIVSGSDDRSIKLWRYNDSRGWETDTFRGHMNNVSCVLFHPHEDLLISNSEDKTLRIWDYTKRGSQPIIHRRDTDRFWVLAAHPRFNMMAAGHDSGMLIFKLAHERPAYCVFEDSSVYYMKDKTIYVANLSGSNENTLSFESKAIANLEEKIQLPASLFYSASDNSLVLSSSASKFYTVLNARIGSTDLLKKGSGNNSVFVARNRFAVFDKDEHKLLIKALDNTVAKTISISEEVISILPSSSGTVLLVSPDCVQLFDLQEERVVASIGASGVKYAAWSLDGSKLALFGTHSLFGVDKKSFSISFHIRENITIKSCIWDSRDILFVSTSHHLKYVLPNADVGIICSLESPQYLISVNNDRVTVIDRSSQVHTIHIDPTEYMFKLALLEGDMKRVKDLIEQGTLIGQSIISYLRQKGFAEIALGFVQDPATRFELSVECCDLESALIAARSLNKKSIWSKLAEESMMMGNFVIAEQCYLSLGNENKLAFLYLLTGNNAKLQALTDDARVRGDFGLRIQNDIFLGDTFDFANSLVEADLPSLAYIACKSSGLEVEAQDILKSNGKTAEDLSSLCSSKSEPIKAVFSQSQPWPLTGDPIATRVNFTQPSVKSKVFHDESAVLQNTEMKNISDAFGIALDEAGIESGGWDVDEHELKLDDIDLPEEVSFSAENFVDVDDEILPSAGPDNSSKTLLPVQAFASGNITAGCQMLKDSFGVVNVSVLEPFIMKGVQSGMVTYSIFNGVTKFVCPHDSNNVVGQASIFTPSSLEEELQAALQLTTSGKFSDALKIFENTLQACLFSVANDENDVGRINGVIDVCKEYIQGIKMEQLRKELTNTDEKRSLSLACYFSMCKLEKQHLILALRSALTQAYKLNCFGTAGKLARRLLQCDPPEATAVQARKVLGLAEKLPLNHVDPFPVETVDLSVLTFDARELCPLSVDDAIKCPFCSASYKSIFAGSVCNICQVSEIGVSCSGPKSLIS